MSESGLTAVPREARTYQGRRAGIVTRLAASVIDAAVVGLFLLTGYAAVAGLLFVWEPRGFTFPDLGVVVSLASALAVLVAYLTLAWWISGRTYGCLVMGLRVVNYRNDRLRLTGALLRALFCAFFPLGLLWVAVSPSNRSIQDEVLRTSVVYDWQPRTPKG
ncbi:MAG TPA: RDD family protein [Nocardioidaceae bacterium]|nr:RDD family protein [Nocardioidaceae bacterium]